MNQDDPRPRPRDPRKYDPENPITLNEEQHRAIYSMKEIHAAAHGLIAGKQATMQDVDAAVARVSRHFDDGFWTAGTKGPPTEEEMDEISRKRGARRIDRHESYIMLSYSRVTGNPGQLFGSPLDDHATFFMLRAVEGHREVDESGREHFTGSGRVLFEIRVSNEQFVSLITGMNIGYGTPATLAYLMGREMAKPPTLDSELNEMQAATEAMMVGTELQAVLKEARAMEEEYRRARSEEKKKVSTMLLKLIYSLDNNARYRLTMYREATAKVTGHAKREILGFVDAVAHAAGAAEIAKRLAAGVSAAAPQLPAAEDEDRS